MHKHKVLFAACGMFVLLVATPSFAQEAGEAQGAGERGAASAQEAAQEPQANQADQADQTDQAVQFFDEASVPVEFAEDDADPAVAPNSLVSFSLYLRVFLILGLLIILIYFTLKFLRRLSLQQKPNQQIGAGIRVLSSQMLYADRMLHVVEVAGECYLLGSSASNVALLDHYKEKDVKDRILLETTQGASPEAGQSPSFFDLLRRRIKPQDGASSQVKARPYGERLRNAVQTLQGSALREGKAGSEAGASQQQNTRQKDAL